MAFLNVQIEWSRQGKAYTVLQCLLLGAVWLAQDRGRSVSVARGLWLAALSPAVAGALDDLPRLGLEIAETPDARSMLLAVQRLIASATAS